MVEKPHQTPRLSVDGAHKAAVGDEQTDEVSSPYMTVPQAADYLCVSKNYLDKLRVSGRGPPFARLGRRKVLYRRSDLDQWVAGQIFASTSQYDF